jgi:hypothetical protein
MVKGSTLAFEKTAEPFCMWSWLMKENNPTDFMLMGFNPAFKKLVNGKANICMPLSLLCSTDVVNFWIEHLSPLCNGAPEVKVYNYHSKSYDKKFDLVVAYPTELLGQCGIAMVFFEKVPAYVVELPEDLVNEIDTYKIDVQKIVEEHLKTLKGIYP